MIVSTGNSLSKWVPGEIDMYGELLIADGMFSPSGFIRCLELLDFAGAFDYSATAFQTINREKLLGKLEAVGLLGRKISNG